MTIYTVHFGDTEKHNIPHSCLSDSLPDYWIFMAEEHLMSINKPQNGQEHALGKFADSTKLWWVVLTCTRACRNLVKFNKGKSSPVQERHGFTEVSLERWEQTRGNSLMLGREKFEWHIRRNFFTMGSSNMGTGCLKRLWVLHLWKYSNLIGQGSSEGWTKDLQRCLPI